MLALFFGMQEFIRSTGALFTILNPFLMSVYLFDLIRELRLQRFASVLWRAGLISVGVFCVFAFTGDALFKDVLQVRFASFLLFGGLIWLMIGIRFVLHGSMAVTALRGPPEHLAGPIAMPFMIGPGTVSASIFAGARLPTGLALLSTVTAVFATILCVILMKIVHDHVATRYSGLVERYIDIVGRLSALIVGTFAVDMLLSGLDLYAQSTKLGR